MKKLLLVTALTISSQALAGGSLLMRGDYINTRTTQGSTETGSSTMTPQNMLLNTDGKLGSADFKLVLNLLANNGSGAVAWPDFIDEASLTKTVGDWAFSAGKLGVLAGGFEAGLITSGQTYLKSLASTGGLVATPGNQMGMGMQYTFGTHSLSVQGLNDTTTTTANPTRRHSVGFSYKAALLEKTLNIVAGQTAFATDNSTTKTLAATNIGIQYMGIENLSLSLDQITNSAKADSTGAKADMTSSLLLEARYKMGMHTPVFKYETSEDKSQEDATLAASKKRTGMSLAVEVTPVENDPFVYFFGYNNVKDLAGNAGATESSSTLLFAGFTFTGNFWK